MRSLIIAVAMCAIAPAAFAQTSQSSTSGAVANSYVVVPGGYGNGTGAGSGTQTEVVHSVSNAIAPTLYSANPCSAEAAGSLGLMNLGMSFGMTSELKSCTQRAWFGNLETAAKATGNPAYEATAIGVACLNDDVKKAAPIGFCPGDTRVPATPVVAPVAAVRAPARRPDWCSTFTTADGPEAIANYKAVCVN